MVRFMRPGLHSGTLPKLFRKIRRAHRKARRSGQSAELLAHKHFDQLEHVQHSLARYVQRELVHLLHQSPLWKRRLAVGQIQLSSNSVRVELLCPELGPAACWLAFEEQSRWLVVGIAQAGWLADLPPSERSVLRNALIGLYKTSGVQVIQQQIERLLPQPGVRYNVSEEGLVVWPGEGYESEVIYDLDREGPIEPRAPRGRRLSLPVPDQRDLLFDLSPLPWAEWVSAWEHHNGEPHPLLDRFRILPSLGNSSAESHDGQRPEDAAVESNA